MYKLCFSLIELQVEREKYRKNLENELKKLQQSNLDGMAAFDESLLALFNRCALLFDHIIFGVNKRHGKIQLLLRCSIPLVLKIPDYMTQVCWRRRRSFTGEVSEILQSQ